MASFILRNGEHLPADEAFEAWTSQNLDRMLAARSKPTHPVDRHFLLMGIVGQAYSRRGETEMRKLCLETGMQHLAEFDAIAPVLAADLGGVLPRVPTFTCLATVLTEDGRFDEAVAVCERAIEFGLRDGTKGDFPARIGRILKAKHKSRRHAS